MNLEHILSTSPTKQWTTRQTIVLEGADGPRYGVCSLANPHCDFFFRLYAEPIETDLLALRLYAASDLPTGTVQHIENLLQNLGQPIGPLWIPIWNFTDASMRHEVEGRLDALLVAARPTGLLIATVDWLHFEGCWNADVISASRRSSQVERKSR